MSELTIFEALNRASQRLKSAEPIHTLGARNPKLDAQILLAACLDRPTSYLFAHGDETLTPEVEDRFSAYIERRVKHEPIAYILGEKEFYKRPFNVTPATLIPRPETELLVEWIMQEAGNNTLILDVGTGSGAIAVTLAAETNSEVIATDISREALKVAHQNAKRHGVADRVAFLEGNLLKPFFEIYSSWAPHARPETLLIAANLPYLTERQWDVLDPDVRDFEPKTALTGGLDGLSFYDELLMQLAARRKDLPAVKVFFEIDPSQASSIVSLIRHYFRDAETEGVRDMSGNWRLVKASL